MFDRQQSTVARTDPELWAAIQAEDARQEAHIELIASENYASPAVMQAQGAKGLREFALEIRTPNDGRAQGFILTCVSRPLTPTTIEIAEST